MKLYQILIQMYFFHMQGIEGYGMDVILDIYQLQLPKEGKLI